jgi:peptidoglycan/LPS O-acetylase OafA/YrhL
MNTDSAESGNLDLLRSFAVLCVVAFHLLLVFFGAQHVPLKLDYLGHWGVLIFFVHTSLVLMASLERQARSGRASYGDFLIRRCFRILPLSMLVVLAIAVLRLPVGHLRDGHFVAVSFAPRNVLQNLLLVQNVGDAESLEAPLWSLPYEMQMYLLLPVLFWLVVRARSQIVVLGMWAAVALLALARRHGTEVDLVDYAPCFLAGVAAYAVSRRQRPYLAAVLWPVTIAFATAFYLRRPEVRDGWLCCLLVGVAAVQMRELPDGWWRQVCKLIARYSYGIYLTHFIFLWLAFDALSGAPWLVQAAVFIATTALVPVALYHGVEAPMIRLGRRLLAPRRGARLPVAAPPLAETPITAAPRRPRPEVSTRPLGTSA